MSVVVAALAAGAMVGQAASTQPDLEVFRTMYLPALTDAKLVRYRDWERANPGEASAWNTYRDALLRGEDPPVPVMSTSFGKMLVAAGTMAGPQSAVPPPDPNTVPASINSTCATDTTSQLQAWVNGRPDGSMLTFPSGACYRVDGGLVLTGRTGLTLHGTGATLRAPTVGDGHRPNIRLANGSSLTVRGFRLEGGYTNPGTLDPAIQWSHGIEVLGTQTVLVEDVTVTNVSGDCIYLGLGTQRTRDATVRRLTCTGTGRNGVSFVAADRSRVEQSSTNGIGYVSFDVEPNTGTGFGVDTATITGNTIGSYVINALTIVGNAPVNGVSFTNNHVTAPTGARIQVTGLPRRTNVTISGNTATHTLSYPQAVRLDNVDGATVTGNTLPTTGVLLRCSSVTGLVFEGNSPNTRDAC